MFGLESGDTGQTSYVEGREFRMVGAKKEKDLSQYVDRRTRGTEREVVLGDLRERAGAWEERRGEKRGTLAQEVGGGIGSGRLG